MKKILAACAILLLSTGAGNPILVPEVSQHEIQVRQGFTGTELLLFGAILNPSGARAAREYDIVVVLKGPTQPMVLREKRKIGGMWVNAESITLATVPSFYAVASSRPINQIIDEHTALRREIGLRALKLSPVGTIAPATQERFAAGLVDLMVRHGLYSQNENAVGVTEQVLYQARIALPSSVKTGRYTAITYAINNGRVVALVRARVDVRKLGLEKAVADFAQNDGLAYGVLAVMISVAMGWLAGRVLSRI